MSHYFVEQISESVIFYCKVYSGALHLKLYSYQFILQISRSYAAMYNIERCGAPKSL